MQELLAAWHDVIPPHRRVLLASFDLQLTSRRPSGGGGGLTNGHGAADQRRLAFGAGRSSSPADPRRRSGRGIGTDAIAADAATGYAEQQQQRAVLVSSMCMIRPVRSSPRRLNGLPPPWRMAAGRSKPWPRRVKRCRPRRRSGGGEGGLSIEVEAAALEEVEMEEEEAPDDEWTPTAKRATTMTTTTTTTSMLLSCSMARAWVNAVANARLARCVWARARAAARDGGPPPRNGRRRARCCGRGAALGGWPPWTSKRATPDPAGGGGRRRPAGRRC